MKIVREMYEASNRGDFERARERFHRDVELIVPETLPDPGLYRGRDELFRYFANWYLSLFESFHAELRGMTQFGNVVVVEHQLQGKGRTSGADVTQDSASVLTVRDGVIVRTQPQASLQDATAIAKEEAAFA